MCMAWSRLGSDVDLIVPKLTANEDSSLYTEHLRIMEHSGVKIRPIGCLDYQWLKKVSERTWYLTRLLSFSLHAALLVGLASISPRKKSTDNLIYSRDPLLIFLCRIFLRFSLKERSLLCLEAHYEINHSAFLLGRSIPIVCISKSLARFYSSHVKTENIYVEHDGVFVDDWKGNRPFDLYPQTKKRRRIILYAGSAHTWKGVSVVVRALNYLPSDYKLILLGINREEMSSINPEYQNLNRIKCFGHLNQRKLRRLYLVADYHIVPTLPQDGFGRHTSPLKLFEYMAVGGRIFASDIPSIAEVVINEKNGILFQPGDAIELANKLLNTSDEVLKSISNQAAVDAWNYDWKGRAERIALNLKKNKNNTCEI